MTDTAATTSTGSLRTASATGRGWGGSSVWTQVRVLTARSLHNLATDPQAIVFGLVQPLIMLVLFSQVFGNMIDASALPEGESYIDYLMPAILVNTAMMSALQTGVGLTQDLTNGVIARFRAMPIRMGTVLVARSLSDLLRGAIQLTLMTIVAVVVFGYDPAGGPAGIVFSGLLAVALGAGLGWIFLGLGTVVRNAEAMQTIGMTIMFPLMFASSAFVTVESLPSWLQVIATINPMTYAVDAARSLALGTSTGTDWMVALAAIAAIGTVGAAIAARGIRKP